MMNAVGIFIGAGGIDAYKAAAKDLALQHQTRVLAAGGELPSLSNLQSFIYDLLKAVGSRDTADILLTADPHLTGYKVGATATQTNTVFSLNQNTDLTQATSAAQPLLLPWDKTTGNYWWGSGVDGNGISTPHTPTNTPITNFSISTKCKFNSLTDQKTIISKGSSISGGATSQAGSFVLQRNTNAITLNIIGQDKVNYNFNYPNAININTIYDIKINVNFDLKTVVFNVNNTIATVSMSTNLVSMNVDTNFNYVVGARGNISRSLDGYIYYANVATSDYLSNYVSFNANDFNKSYSQLSQLSKSGEIWTYNYSLLTTGYKSQLVYRNTTQTDGINDYMQTSNYAFNQPFTNYNYFRNINFLSSSVIFDGKSLNENKLYLAGLTDIRINSGVELGSVTTVMKVFNVLSSVRNTTISKLQLNKDSGISGNAGVNNSTGFTIGCSGAIANFSNTEYGLQLAINGIHDKTKRDKIVDIINNYSDSFFFDTIGVLDISLLNQFTLS